MTNVTMEELAIFQGATVEMVDGFTHIRCDKPIDLSQAAVDAYLASKQKTDASAVP